MRGNTINNRSVIIILRLRSPRKRVNIRKQDTEIGSETLGEIEFTRGRESGESFNERVDTVE